MSKLVPQCANPYLLDFGSNLSDVGLNMVINHRLKINFNLENLGLKVYNVDEYIARLQIQDAKHRVCSLVSVVLCP